MQDAKASGPGVLWVALGQGGGQILSLLIFLVIARHVSPASFGVVAVSLAALELIRRVLIDPVTYVVTARPDVRSHDFDVCFSLLAIISTTAAVMVLLAAPLLAGLIGVPEAASPLRVLSLILIAFGLSGTSAAWLVRKMAFRALAVRSTASVVIGGIIGIAMAIGGYELWSLVGQQLAVQCVNVVALYTSAEWRPKLALKWADIRDTVRKAWPISTGAVWTSVANDADLFFAAAYLGPATAGLYNAGKRIMLAADMMLVNTIGTVALPAFANTERQEQRATALLDGLRFTALVTAPAFAGLAMVAPEFVTLVLGPRWSAAAPILTALAISGFAASLGQFATYLLLVEQRSHFDSVASAISAAVNVAAFLLVVRYGPVALAATVSLTAFLVLPIRFRFALRDHAVGFGELFRAIAPSVVVTAGMILCLVAGRQLLPAASPWLTLLGMIGMGVGSYALLLHLISPDLSRMVARMLAVSVARAT